MAKKTEARTPSLLLSLLFFLTLFNTAHTHRTHHAHHHGGRHRHDAHRGSIGIYWAGGNLTGICAIGTFAYVNIDFLDVFGSGQTPFLTLGNNCNPLSDCTILSDQIRYCQRKGIKVMLSIGGVHGGYNLTSKADAKNVSLYLWNTFLGGCSSNRPFGSAILDGIDFYIKTNSYLYWDDLARYLHSYNKPGKKKTVYLSASPGCAYPDNFLGTALATGLFDFVSILYYDSIISSSCAYVGDNNTTNLLKSWAVWTKSVKAEKFFLGLVAVQRPPNTIVLPGGFVPVDVLTSQVLPVVKKSRNYGGVMIWDWDFNVGYTTAILSSVR